jgi:hypothetical protein
VIAPESQPQPVAPDAQPAAVEAEVPRDAKAS